MISAAITPGIQPQMVRINTIKTDPHPLSKTASGGNNIESNTLQILISDKVTINNHSIRPAIIAFVTPYYLYIFAII